MGFADVRRWVGFELGRRAEVGVDAWEEEAEGMEQGGELDR